MFLYSLCACISFQQLRPETLRNGGEKSQGIHINMQGCNHQENRIKFAYAEDYYD